MKIENIFEGTGCQIDLLNTLYGGCCLTKVNIEEKRDALIINLFAPSVSKDNFNVLVECNNVLVVYALLKTNNCYDNNQLAIPMFMQTFDIPSSIASENIEAYYEGNRYKIRLPFKK